MGGKFADAAYWTIDSAFVSSKYYMNDLPAWVKAFNRSGMIESYFGKIWQRLLPEQEYAAQGPDDVAGENDRDGIGRVFPHIVRGLHGVVGESYFDAFDCSPFSSEALAEFAMQAIINEKLGQRGVTDMLCIGFSANDRIGHAFGPNSHEVMDVTIRTDRILEKLFAFINEKVGLQFCTMMLTADHGVAPMPEVLQAQNPQSGALRVDGGDFVKIADAALTQRFGALSNDTTWIIYQDDEMIYLNPAALAEKNISAADAERVVKSALQSLPYVHAVYTHTELASGNVFGELGKKAWLSFHPPRSANIFLQLNPWVLNDDRGTTHGQPWSYDSHVALLWYGVGIKPGKYYQQVEVADIAPTLASILGVQPPAAVQGRALDALIK